MEYPGWIPFCKKNIESCIVLQYFPLSIMCLKNPVRYWLPLLTKYFEVFHSDTLILFIIKISWQDQIHFITHQSCSVRWVMPFNVKQFAGSFFSTQGVRREGEELRGFESMEQLLLSGKDGWKVPWRRPGTSVGEEGYGWLGPLPTFTSICYSCPNSFTSTNAIFQALKPPTQPRPAILLGSLHMLLQWEEKQQHSHTSPCW